MRDKEAAGEFHPHQGHTCAPATCVTGGSNTRLVNMTGPTKNLGGVGKEMGRMDVENEVQEAYEVVKRIDMLDVSVGTCFLLRGVLFSGLN
jgi:hypothetical protein